MTKRLTTHDFEAIRIRAEAATEWSEWVSVSLRIAEDLATGSDVEFVYHAREDIPLLLAEIERLRGNLRTIEVMTSCDDTKDFAKRALSGDATIEI